MVARNVVVLNMDFKSVPIPVRFRVSPYFYLCGLTDDIFGATTGILT